MWEQIIAPPKEKILNSRGTNMAVSKDQRRQDVNGNWIGDNKSLEGPMDEDKNKNLYTFKEFCDVAIVNIAVNAFDRPPKNLGHMPPVVAVIELFKHFTLMSQKRGENSLVWEAPDLFDHQDIKERDKIIDLNRKLKTDPDIWIPKEFEI